MSRRKGPGRKARKRERRAARRHGFADVGEYRQELRRLYVAARRRDQRGRS